MGCCLSCIEGDEDDKPAAQSSLSTGMLRERKGDYVLDKYEIVKRIGQGSMGSVAMVRVKDSARGGSAFTQKKKGPLGMVTHKKSNGAVEEKRAVQVDYALKTIMVSRVSPEFVDELKNEIALLKQMDHPNIVKAYEVFTRNWDIAIIMELCSGGDLHARVPYSESDAARYTRQLLSAIKYMHSKNIVHRDLKFENIMFENTSPEAQIKLIDFGLSIKYGPGEKYMHDGVGTIYTMAPQVLQGVYTSQADLWSVGVITYMLLSSEKPFFSRKRRRVIDKIMRCDYDFDSPVWRLITDDAKDFVSSLIVLNPKERLDATEALEHRWLKRQRRTMSLSEPAPELAKDIEAGLLKYAGTSDLKKLALNVIAHKSSPAEIKSLRNAFTHYDMEKDGYITFDEFHAALKRCDYDDDMLKDLFNSIDVTRDGKISYCEFLAAVLEARSNIDEERVADCFDHLDSSDTGYISKEDLASLLGQDKNSEDIKRLIEEADTNKDGQISFPEFMAYFRKDEEKLAQQVVHMDSSMQDDSVTLVGLDAVIPGGKFDKHSSQQQ